MIGPRHDNQCMVMVVGMHRRCNSALTATLAQTVSRQPSNLLALRYYNQDGFSERESIVAPHDDILAAADRASDDPARWKPSQLDAVRDRRLRRRLLPLWHDPGRCILRRLPYPHPYLARYGPFGVAPQRGGGDFAILKYLDAGGD